MADGRKVPPATDDQVPPVAEPPTEPPNGAVVPPLQIELRAEPTFATGDGITI